jgi:hypothetical protein
MIALRRHRGAFYRSHWESTYWRADNRAAVIAGRFFDQSPGSLFEPEMLKHFLKSRTSQLWNLGYNHEEQLPASFCMDDCDETNEPPPSWQAEIPTGP